MVLIFINLLATSIWIGGAVAVVFVTRTARRRLTPADQIAFFKDFGKTWGIVGTSALLVALASGAILIADQGWTTTATIAAIVAGLLLLTTFLAMRQARRISELRRDLLDHSTDELRQKQVRAAAKRASQMRGLLGILTLILLGLGSAIAA